MKKIINGKMYNTETAVLIADYNNDLGDGDFYHFSESLYRKKTGEFYIYGYGGPLSKYSKQCSGGWSGGSAIIPLTEEEAKEWLELHGSCNDYINCFGEPEE